MERSVFKSQYLKNQGTKKKNENYKLETFGMLTVCNLLVAVFYFVYEIAWTSSFKTELLEEINKHRRNADLTELVWSDEQEKVFRRIVQDNCNGVTDNSEFRKNMYNNSALAGNNYNKFPPLPVGTEPTEFALKISRDIYNTGLEKYRYPTSSPSCKSKNTLSQNQRLFHIMSNLTVDVSWNIIQCPNKKVTYYVNSYNVNRNLPFYWKPEDPLFPEENFIKICHAESGWKSCDDDLQSKCPNRLITDNEGLESSPDKNGQTDNQKELNGKQKKKNNRGRGNETTQKKPACACYLFGTIWICIVAKFKSHELN